MLNSIMVIAVLYFALERVIPDWPRPRVRTRPLRALSVNLFITGDRSRAGVKTGSEGL